MNLIEINNQTKGKFAFILIKKTVDNFFRSYNLKDKTITIALVGDKTIRRLNKIYLGIDDITDILAFNGDKDFFGEIIIDYQQIRRQARRFNNTIKQELIFVLVHGLLHLLGYDDKTEKERKRMMRLGEEMVRKLNF